MKSKRAKGTYYLNKAKKYFQDLGWKTEKLEVAIPFFIGGRAIFSRKDLLGADLFIWNNTECALVQVKSTEDEKYISKHRSEAKSELLKHGVPLKKIIVIYLPKKKPIIEEVKSPVG